MKKITALSGTVFTLMLLVISNISAAQNSDEIQKQTASSGIEYAAGGVGDGDRQTMGEMKKDYDLHLTFARSISGEYLADVAVTIENSKREAVLCVVSPGPFLFANLENGHYRVTAMFNGATQTHKVSIVNHRPTDVVYYF